MKEYLHIIKARSGLFRGIEENELEKMFGCLEARKQTYRKEEYILREGEQTKVLGLVLSGSVLIVQDDVWGGRNVLSVLGPGQCFASGSDFFRIHVFPFIVIQKDKQRLAVHWTWKNKPFSLFIQKS